MKRWEADKNTQCMAIRWQKKGFQEEIAPYEKKMMMCD